MSEEKIDKQRVIDAYNRLHNRILRRTYTVNHSADMLRFNMVQEELITFEKELDLEGVKQ